MALPLEMQATVDMQNAIENNRADRMASAESKRVKLDTLRMAKDIVMENHKTAAAGSVVGATDITAMATTLEAFVNS
tara:strand:- start:191 stop:421 length:231 start_codon:yes stop_codon:yes gene_type:complete